MDVLYKIGRHAGKVRRMSHLAGMAAIKGGHGEPVTELSHTAQKEIASVSTEEQPVATEAPSTVSRLKAVANRKLGRRGKRR